MASEGQKGHKLRLSIDIRSLKDHQFTAQLYLKYASYSPLNMGNFKSAPAMPISNAKVETTLNNCFSFCHFQSNGEDLESRLRHSLRVELWHYDRLHNDVLLGIACIDLLTLLDCPLRKFNESYARVFDAYVPVDELDSEGAPIKTIASLRVLIYLEDQGSIAQLLNQGADIKALLQQPPPEIAEPKLPSEITNDALKLELADLEYKVVWELETWKRAEEAKTRILLQQKEGEFWTHLAQEQKKIQLEKEKQFKKMEANLNNLQTKVKSKISELMRREQKIIVLEQQLQNKINEVSKECLSKDEQIDRIRQRHKDERSSMIKEKAALQIEIAKGKAQIVRLKMEVEQTKKQQDKSIVNVLKNELNSKQLQIKQLSMELQKCNQIKEEYKVYYNKMKEELISVRKQLNQKDEVYKEMKYQKDIAENNLKNVEQQLNYQRNQKQYQQQSTAVREQDSYRHQPTDQRERLIRARQDLLNQGLYSPNDDLIKQYDQSISELS